MTDGSSIDYSGNLIDGNITISNLPVGEYLVTVKDEISGCIAYKTGVIEYKAPFEIIPQQCPPSSIFTDPNTGIAFEFIDPDFYCFKIVPDEGNPCTEYHIEVINGCLSHSQTLETNKFIMVDDYDPRNPAYAFQPIENFYQDFSANELIELDFNACNTENSTINVYDCNGCMQSIQYTPTVSPSIGKTNTGFIVQPELKIAPNPFRKEVQLTYGINDEQGNMANVSIIITAVHISGQYQKVLLKKDIQKGELYREKINFEHLPAGAYVFHLQTSEGESISVKGIKL